MFRVREPKLKVIYKETFGDAEWRSVHGIADYYQPQMVESFARAVRNTKGNIDKSALNDAIAIASVEAAFNSIPWETFVSELSQLAMVFKLVYDKTGENCIRFLPKKVSLEANFNKLNPHSLDYIKSHTGDLIVEITDESKMAVRKIINDAFVEGLHPYQSSKLIEKVVGLTQKQANAVNNLRKSMVTAGYSDKLIEQKTNAYAKRLLVYRSKNISRTETINAANRGQQSLWEQNADKGLIDRQTTKRVWITTPDDKLCVWCRSLNGKRVGLEEDFKSDSINGTDYTTLTPTLHPHCRCALGLVFL